MGRDREVDLDLEVLQHSCKRQNGEKRPCRTSAKSKMGEGALAEVLQASKWGKASLQKSCKVQNGEKRPCRSPANVKMGKSALAEVLQSPKWGKASLQKSCKHQNEEKLPCRSPAKAKMRESVLAGLLQAFPGCSLRTLRRLVLRGAGKGEREGVESVGGEGVADVDGVEAADGTDDGEP